MNRNELWQNWKDGLDQQPTHQSAWNDGFDAGLASCADEIRLLKSTVSALWLWTKAEIEHFDGPIPDDEILDLVRRSLGDEAAGDIDV